MAEQANANELADVLAGLRVNLEAAQKAGVGHDVRFAIDTIEVELHVATTGEKKAQGGIKFWVLNLGGEAAGKDEHIQKIKLTMKAVDKDGKPLAVSSADTRG
jgi:hypothetical protein